MFGINGNMANNNVYFWCFFTLKKAKMQLN